MNRLVAASKLHNVGRRVALLSGPTVHSLYCGNVTPRSQSHSTFNSQYLFQNDRDHIVYTLHYTFPEWAEVFFHFMLELMIPHLRE